jgi:hypothetical protein
MKQHEAAVRFGVRVREAIRGETIQAAGSEVGGILLGRHEGDEVVIDDFEPVPCEHRFGRYYFLSDEDLRGLAESVEWFRALPASHAERGLEVLGFFRSRARPGSSWNERDEELMRRFFADSGSLLVLVKCDPGEAFDAEVFVLDEGDLRPAGPRPAAAETRPSERPAGLPPPTRPRLREPEEAPDRSWWWVGALVALTIVGAVLGYRSVSQPAASAPARQQPAMAGPQAPAAAIPKPSPMPADSVSPAMEHGIQSAIEQWQHAILSGDPDLIAACYAPQLERYFDQRNSSSARVRQAALRSFQHFGKPAILRVSELAILPETPDRAIATFRKHWQTHGPKVFGGEEQERLAFVLDRDGTPPSWKIVSEEETKVYWTERPRTRGSGTR